MIGFCFMIQNDWRRLAKTGVFFITKLMMWIQNPRNILFRITDPDPRVKKHRIPSPQHCTRKGIHGHGYAVLNRNMLSTEEILLS
jgi:hypothetical protein